VAVRDVALQQGGGQMIRKDQDGGAEEMAAALRSTGLFQDVRHVAGSGPAPGYDATIVAAYKDETDPGMIGFVFPPCVIPFVDLCIIPVGKVHIALAGTLQAGVADASGQPIKAYAEKATGACEYIPFPGLFPFNLALIAPEVSCHNQEGPEAAFKMAVAKLAADLAKDRDLFAPSAGRAPRPQAVNVRAPAAETSSPAAAPAAPGKPWWQSQ
jgi:hypothetical protein